MSSSGCGAGGRSQDRSKCGHMATTVAVTGNRRWLHSRRKDYLWVLLLELQLTLKEQLLLLKEDVVCGLC